jgi:hypothetical protein
VFETGEGAAELCHSPSSDADFVGATFSHKGRRKKRKGAAE